MSNTPDTKFPLDVLFDNVNEAFLSAAAKLRESFATDAWKDSPFVYHIPKMTLKVQLSLSYTKSEMKGFFSKDTSGTDQSMVSEITFEVVAVPRPAVGPTPAAASTAK